MVTCCRYNKPCILSIYSYKYNHQPIPTNIVGYSKKWAHGPRDTAATLCHVQGRAAMLPPYTMQKIGGSVHSAFFSDNTQKTALYMGRGWLKIRIGFDLYY